MESSNKPDQPPSHPGASKLSSETFGSKHICKKTEAINAALRRESWQRKAAAGENCGKPRKAGTSVRHHQDSSIIHNRWLGGLGKFSVPFLQLLNSESETPKSRAIATSLWLLRGWKSGRTTDLWSQTEPEASAQHAACVSHHLPVCNSSYCISLSFTDIPEANVY